MLGKLHEMMANGKLTPYVYRQCLGKIKNLPKKMQSKMLKEASIMSDIGVSSEKDHKTFLYISIHAGRIAKELSSKNLSKDNLAKISFDIYSKNYPINTIYNFYEATKKALDNLDIPIKKFAYPIGMGGSLPDAPHDVSKWVQAMREIYARVHKGWPYTKAFEVTTANWDIMEKHDFKAWKRFYTENAQDKYKTAQLNDYYHAQDGSPLIPFNALRSKPSGFSLDLPNHIQEEKQKKIDEQAVRDAERREFIAENRRKLLSRLNSAERLMTDFTAQEDVNQAIDMGLDSWLEMLHSLKRSIQMAPIKSAKSTLLHDLIIRQGNVLKRDGFNKSANLLYVLAQDAPKAPSVDELEQSSPDMLSDLANESEEDETDEAMNDFVKMLNHQHLDEDDSEALDHFIAEAQLTENLDPEASIEVTDEPKTDDVMNKALENITIQDVIERLELVSNIVQNREIPRQLAFVDMMLGRLNIATFFPNLGEAQRSSLESNQYVNSRIEDILSKLRGSIEPSEGIDLTTNRGPQDIEAQNIVPDTLDSVRENLDKAEQQEKAKAKARKAKKDQKEQSQAAPPITPEEIAGPVNVETAPPIRAT